MRNNPIFWALPFFAWLGRTWRGWLSSWNRICATFQSQTPGYLIDSEDYPSVWTMIQPIVRALYILSLVYLAYQLGRLSGMQTMIEAHQ